MPERELPTLQHFPLKTTDKTRYRDTDRQGHVNNAVFSSFLETGRVEVLYKPEAPLTSDGGSFVIASIHLEFFREVTWPGQVQIGSRVMNVGRSSVRLEQALFQEGVCAARAETVIVQMNEETRRSMPLGEAAVVYLNGLMQA
jgi:acyl-CoA thioester hydrolase